MVTPEYRVLELQFIKQPIHFLEKPRLVEHLEITTEALLGPDRNPVSNRASQQLMHWRFIITSQCLRSQISLAGITFQQTLALTCMDALMPWAQGCAGTVQVLADTVRDGVRDLGIWGIGIWGQFT